MYRSVAGQYCFSLVNPQLWWESASVSALWIWSSLCIGTVWVLATGSLFPISLLLFRHILDTLPPPPEIPPQQAWLFSRIFDWFAKGFSPSDLSSVCSPAYMLIHWWAGSASPASLGMVCEVAIASGERMPRCTRARLLQVWGSILSVATEELGDLPERQRFLSALLLLRLHWLLYLLTQALTANSPGVVRQPDI